ncbi:hypothetical protein SCUCBS95973_005435 [Sporothrix curviconia]|uniref:Enoyl reductase (ER) domain-containing protein n=1 Tax=Sporothrix curviconia TaxID=1260050 RepID=A0ABP0BWW9_9PEZI
MATITAIPTTQTAIWVDQPGGSALITLRGDVTVPTPKENELLVRIDHSDIYNMMGHHPMDVHIPGHEGVGVVVQMGSRVAQAGSLRLGHRVGIKWIHETCGQCPACQRNSTACPRQHNSGRDRDGTLQQYVTVPASHATPIPDGISSEVAAPLLCAGLTMYSALGNGVQIAVQKGLKVIAIDGADKKDFCMGLGASAFFSFSDPDLEHKIKSLTDDFGAHAVVCCPGSEAAYNQGIKLLRPGGTLVCVGLPSNGSYTMPLRPMDMVNRGLHVIGSAVGTEAEMQELLQLASTGAIAPQIDVMPLSRFAEAIEAVKTSRAAGKIVLKIS